MPELTDEEIIKQYEEGDDSAFRELIERYSSLIFNFIAHLAGSGNATDLTQDIFIKAWKNLKKFNSEKASFKTWLFTIARNTAIDFLKKRKSIVFSKLENEENPDFLENISDTELLPDEILIKLENKELLKKLLQELSELEKTVLLLHYQEEMTFEEIGEVLKKSPNTVKSWHYRAILKLRKKLN